MARKSSADAPAPPDPGLPIHTEQTHLYAIRTDYLVNPSSDTPLAGEYTRAELEAAGVEVDTLLGIGVLEETDRVRQAPA